MKNNNFTEAANSIPDISGMSMRQVLTVPSDRGDLNPTETIFAANEGRFFEDAYQEPLTAFAVGYAANEPTGLQAQLDFLAPTVPSGRRFEYMVWTNPEQFLMDTDSSDIRAVGQPFKEIEYTSSKALGQTLNKGLSIKYDLDNVQDIPNYDQTVTARIMDRLIRIELYRAWIALDALANKTGKIWNATAGLDPDQDAIDAVEAFADSMGLYPNRIMYGSKAWVARGRCFRSQLTAGSIESANDTVDEVAMKLGLEEGLISRSRYSTSATAKGTIIPQSALIFRAEQNMSFNDPSNVKRFVSNTVGGTPFRTYRQVDVTGKFVTITVEHYSNILATSTYGVQELQITS